MKEIYTFAATDEMNREIRKHPNESVSKPRIESITSGWGENPIVRTWHKEINSAVM